MKETNLEKLAEKYATTREQIAELLVKNLEVDEDVANLVAMQVVRSGVGNEQVSKISRKRQLQGIRNYLIGAWEGVGEFIGRIRLILNRSK